MTLYFDSLPVEIRSLLIKYLPPEYLAGELLDLYLMEGAFYIFGLDSFKICDTNIFWKELYIEKYGQSNVKTLDYKICYQVDYNNYINFAQERLKYAVRHGHINIVKQLRKKYRYIWFEFDDLFIASIIYLQEKCAEFIDDKYVLESKTYQKALELLLSKNLVELDQDLILSLLDMLCSNGAQFPQINCSLTNISAGKIDFTKKAFENDKWLKFFLKYNVITDHLALLKSLINWTVDINIIEQYLEMFKITITEDVVINLLKTMRYNGFRLSLDHFKLFIKRGYKPNKKTIYEAAHSADIFYYLFDYYIENCAK